MTNAITEILILIDLFQGVLALDAIQRYELKENKYGYTLVVYLKPGLNKFSEELNGDTQKQETLSKQLNRFAKKNFPNQKI